MKLKITLMKLLKLRYNCDTRKSLRESLSEHYIDKISAVDKIISYIITIIFCFAVIQSITLTIIH